MPPKAVRQPLQDAVAASDDRSWGTVSPALPLGEQLSHRVATLIQRGAFGEGGKLPPEAELADRFGVSRPVIREALSRLRAMGFIVSRKGSGSYVRKRALLPMQSSAMIGFGPLNSLAQVRQCFEFRVTVEGDAAYHAAQNRSPELLRVMRGALDRMEEAIATGVVGMNADFEFHIAVARASGNDFYETVMEALRTPIEFVINLARSLAMTRPLDHLLTVQAEHVAMFQAIEASDREAARLAMRTHVEHACQRVFEGPGSGGTPPGIEESLPPSRERG
jgi:GntR family transcriptional regulator, transcriptional repressor for pyruvate dehydrogenase complex